MKIKMIAAVGKNLELGYKNDLIWHFKEDMKFFKEKTLNHVVVMGNNTYLSLPKTLSNRTNIVLSKTRCDFPSDVILYNDINLFLDDYKDKDIDIFVIGGATIYKLFLKYADELYLTEIDDTFKDATVYFPAFNKENYEREVLKTVKENDITYKHVLYRRK